jgi:alpha-1,2-mannosyltransferase
VCRQRPVPVEEQRTCGIMRAKLKQLLPYLSCTGDSVSHAPTGRTPLNNVTLNNEPLSWYEVAAIAIFFGLAALFGVWVEIHSAFQPVRHTDLADFLRAGWAVRSGNDPYRVTEEHGWHYNFPPLLAIVLTPLADPPKGANQAGMVPFPLSVAIWYALSLLFLAAAAHLMARTLEAAAVKGGMRRGPPSARQWWGLRLLPLVICIAPIGFTLSRGQINIALLLLLCAMTAEIVAQRPIMASFCLTGAAAVKVFPIYLVVYPVWRRDWRFLSGCAAGLIITLALIPVGVFGAQRTAKYYAELNRAVFEAAVIGSPDRSRASELIDPSATDSQSFQTIIHNTVTWREQLHVARRLRSTYIAPWIRIAHWMLVAALTAITFAAAGPLAAQNDFQKIALLSTLMMIMLLASPVCHLHYFAMAMPLVAVLLVFGERNGRGYMGGRFAWLLGIYLVLNSLPLIPGLEIFRDLGMATYAALALWVAGITVLARTRASSVNFERLLPSLAGPGPA